MNNEKIQKVINNIINDINENGEVTHPAEETTTPIIRELISFKGKINNTVDNLINKFLQIQIFAKNGGIPVLKEILLNIK